MGKPLWLWFWDKSSIPHLLVSFDEVREKLGELAEPDWNGLARIRIFVYLLICHQALTARRPYTP